jgi:hypothetical protein
MNCHKPFPLKQSWHNRVLKGSGKCPVFLDDLSHLFHLVVKVKVQNSINVLLPTMSPLMSQDSFILGELLLSFFFVPDQVDGKLSVVPEYLPDHVRRYVMDDTASLSNTCANFAGFVASFDWTLTSN